MARQPDGTPSTEHPQTDDIELYRDPEQDADTPESATDRGAARTASDGPRVIAISGAKGGVGKTLLSTNLALYLATIGRRVVVVDADAEGGNVHTFLGVERPGGVFPYVPPLPSLGAGPAVPPASAGPIEQPEEGSNLEEALVDTPVPGLRLLHAGVDEPASGAKRRTPRSRLLNRLKTLDADHVVVDVGAGIERSLLDFWLGSDLSIFVSVPEPTAIENTYRFIRCAFARRLRLDAPDPDTRRSLIHKLRLFHEAPSPLDLARRLEAEDDPVAPFVRSSMDAFGFRIVLNQTRLRADLELGDRMRSAARRRLGVYIDYLGYIDYDDTAWTCVRQRRPLLVESPGTKSSRSIEKLARRLMAIDAGKGPAPPLRTVPPETHHDLLEVDRGASDEEIRRAYKRAKEVYAPDALCCYGLFDASGIEALRARLDEAYDVLLDPARRRPYELSVFPPEPEPQEEQPPVVEEEQPRPPPPTITPDTEFTGGLIRAVRESQGVGMRDISKRTKIGSSYLEAIEEDRFGMLPAPVYVRGFVTELAKCLKLDPDQVARTYVRRYQRYLEQKGEL